MGFQAEFLENDVTASLKAACEQVVDALGPLSSTKQAKQAKQANTANSNSNTADVTWVRIIDVDGNVKSLFHPRARSSFY